MNQYSQVLVDEQMIPQKAILAICNRSSKRPWRHASGEETKRRRADLAEMGKTVRDTAAAASFRDMEKMIKHLDGRLAVFQEG
ncbi:hypothetical protein N7517_008158 [Penicillium concentricum]|uniref:Uncharacterized protein n=1 Tax=Penicillium concentricum TaxID=293559 RepID=A0A9W9RRX1_9EURO|nr:uncharacterized protein N7517_008158 [Penicillium concentricum]KAJ5365272.1 hypothetical protein N7517_008158 [Penicillium concentricum]